MSNPVYNGSDKRLQQLFQNGGGGGGGTTVVANPSGEATDDLEKLQVGETIYDIPAGGGDSSTLAGLDDVNLSSPTDGQVLKYDATNNEWVNGEGGSGGNDLYLNTIYSETEEKVGYWTDGKPIYQKTIHVSNIAVVANQEADVPSSIAAEIDSLSVDTLITANMVLKIENSAVTDAQPVDVYWSSGYSKWRYRAFTDWGASSDRIWYWTIQYTKTMDTPEVPQRGNVIYLPTIYSQEEREVGVWEDGKPLYQKTILCGGLANTGTVITVHNISNIDRITKIVGTAHSTTNGYTLPLDDIDAAAGISGTIRMYANATNIYVQTYRNYTEYNEVVVTIQYTKTTDTAGSGSWTPSGAPAVHYSTDEQVVGMWIDGSALYEKTFSLSSLNCVVDNWTQTSIPRGSMEMIIDISVLIESSTPSVHKGLSGGFINNYVAINSFSTFGTDTGDIAYITVQYTKSS